MTPERWQQIDHLLQSALERPPKERAVFLDQACAGDEALRREVEVLLDADEHAGTFINAPVVEVAAPMITDEPTGSIVSQSLGPYTIVDRVGVGGMGEIYLGHDPRLGRKVALKVLPRVFTQDDDRVRRFIQEAKAASALNHPNIITIYEIGEEEGTHFIATEYIEGETLRAHLKHTRMTLPDVLDVAIQVTSALAAAHEAGIVHRDMKPENVMRRPDGLVKVLDFGLAKLTAPPGDTEALTQMQAETMPGMVMGTVSYMSPEQARGLPLDARTDIFSLGVVIYEMIAGCRPFVGQTSTDTLASILTTEPRPLAEVSAETPGELQRIVSQALRKNREERYQTIRDLLVDLNNLKQELEFAARLRESGSSEVKNPKIDSERKAAVVIEAEEKPVTQSVEPAGPARVNDQRRAVMPALIVMGVVLVIGIIGTSVWRSFNSTPSSPAALESSPTAPERSLSYWIMVQKYRDGKPYQDPFRLAGEINFEKDYRVRLHVNSSQPGFLYILNEGPESTDGRPPFNVLFPSPTANAGSAHLVENQPFQIPEQSWFQFDEQAGTEKLWLIWAARGVPELEAVKEFANPQDKGAINDPSFNRAVNEFLETHSIAKPIVEKNDERIQTTVRAKDDILVHLIKLEHH